MPMPSSQPTTTDRYLDPDSATARLYTEASALIPGGTSRLHYVFQPYPIFAQAGAGCRLTDADGEERIDCLNNMTALIHGHADPDVTAALIEQVRRGVSFSEPSAPEAALARLLVDRVPSVERVHFRSSGTEAVMMAVKLARAFTGRDLIAKFEGHYHGYYDYVQMSVLSSAANWGDPHAPRTVPSSGGLTRSAADDVLTLPFNDFDGVERLLDRHGGRVGALLVEPLSNRSAMAGPAPGFFAFLRDITRQHGIVLIFDEVIAFRLGPDGAQGRFGGSPDLTTFGKIIGGGLPIGAIGGRADIMRLLDPASGGGLPQVFSGGTYSGNPLSATGGIATLAKLTSAEFARLDAMGRRMRDGVNAIFRSAGEKAQATGEGSLFQIVPTDQPIDAYRSIPRDAAANAWLDRMHRGLLRAGVIISSRGLGCLSTPMGEVEVDQCLAAFEQAVAGLND
jgi:glutamate-1-semialdehyde 2,1-aminomutase